MYSCPGNQCYGGRGGGLTSRREGCGQQMGGTRIKRGCTGIRALIIVDFAPREGVH